MGVATSHDLAELQLADAVVRDLTYVEVELKDGALAVVV